MNKSTHPPRQVLVVANARIPGERAQSIQTVRTAAAFARAGCETHLLYARRNVKRKIEGVDANSINRDPLQYYGVAEKIHLHPIPVIDFIEAVPQKLQYLPARMEEFTFGWNAAKKIKQFPGALVHCREVEVGALLSKRKHPYYLFEAHSIPGNRFRKAWMRRALDGALGIVTITHALADDVAAEFNISRNDICVVPDAYDPAGFVNLPSRDAARQQLELLGYKTRAEDFYVVYAGHLFAWKGVDTLVEAARLAPRIQFRLVGGLPGDVARVRANVEKLQIKNVEVLGHRAPSEIPLHLAAADIITIPNSAKQQISARHTSPLKLFEAMAAGRAIVASDLLSLREVLADGRNARLVAPDDPGPLAAAILQLAGDAAARAALAASAVREAANYTFDSRVRSLLSFAAERAARKKL
ncbi:MAG: glycosyltransferase family 4 protein [Planctomycetota bacterium]